MHAFLGYDARREIYMLFWCIRMMFEPLRRETVRTKNTKKQILLQQRLLMIIHNDMKNIWKRIKLSKLLPDLFMTEISSSNISEYFLTLLIINLSASFNIHSDIEFYAVFCVVYLMCALQSLGHFSGVIQMQIIHVSVPLRGKFSVPL